MPLIIAARVVQAVGGAMLTPSSLAIIMSVIEPARRSTAIGTWSAISGTVTSAAPTIGAVAIQFGSWRWAFFIVVPIGLTCFVIGRRWLVESIDPDAGPLPDPLGSVLVFVGVAALAFTIVQSRQWGWLDWRTAAMLTFAAVVGAAFIYRCNHHPVPVINVAIFRTGSFRANAAAALVIGCAFWGVYGVLVAFLTRGLGLFRHHGGTAAHADDIRVDAHELQRWRVDGPARSSRGHDPRRRVLQPRRVRVATSLRRTSPTSGSCGCPPRC